MATDATVDDSRRGDMRFYEDGDFIVGGLIPITYKTVVGGRSVPCGGIALSSALQVEAFRYAIERINNDSSILPEHTLGWDIRDTCSSLTVAAAHAMNVAHIWHSAAGRGCSATRPDVPDSGFQNVPDSGYSACAPRPVSAVVGPKTSDQSLAVASIFAPYEIAMVSYGAETKVLSEYPLAFRTVTSHVMQAHAIMDLMKRFEWKYIAAIAMDDMYGREGIQEARRVLAAMGSVMPGDGGILQSQERSWLTDDEKADQSQ
ncbi:PREDICTED: taste receptor type 1 member 3-like [Priapulus caudatus]|uniref:Taste receptor type 1 member 3-like n=1 Tax=Priapulus caudatus TaxID=37621 RepID=A0ABM1F701_PRICU|nr:PREDICTED: taste receptor type 1 member 3-like [Priapulus caudatus]